MDIKQGGWIKYNEKKETTSMHWSKPNFTCFQSACDESSITINLWWKFDYHKSYITMNRKEKKIGSLFALKNSSTE